ncbi:MAG: class I SAM-dependent methyltransferase, partial [Synergistaceae bacterium]|nr:class I SAM-dependent methyltransferase [Synergistaceae bacterium]
MELGSGAGFLKDLNSEVITSEVFECDGIDMVLDACGHLPFDDGALRAILMTDVFHHLPDVRAFFRESARAVAAGGVISMIEPWVTPWSKVIYGRLHHEPFDLSAREWEFKSGGGGGGRCQWQTARCRG